MGVSVEMVMQRREIENMEDFFVKECVSDRGVVQVWAVPHEFVGEVVLAVNDATGNTASCVTNNVDVESVAQVVLVKLYLLFDETCDCGVFLGGHREVVSFVPPLNCCEEVSAKLFCRGKESAFILSECNLSTAFHSTSPKQAKQNFIK